MPRKTIKPAPPVILTPEQIEANARREARVAAFEAARSDLLTRAHALAEKLHPVRVRAYGRTMEDFSVMFGPADADVGLCMSGPGLVDLRIDPGPWTRMPDSDEFVPPALRFTPRCYSLGSDGDMRHAAALGQALLDAAAFARTLAALLAA